MKIFNFLEKNHNGRVKQDQSGEDGLACIAMILAKNGIMQNMDSLRKTYPQFISGINLKTIKEIIKLFGLESRAIRCPLNELKDIHLPCIIYWDMKQFAVLSSIKDDTFIVLDPVKKKSSYSLEEFEQHYNQIVLEICSNNEPI